MNLSPFPIPSPHLQVVKNLTPFSLFQCDKMGPQRQFYDTLVVKGTFHLSAEKLTLATHNRPIALADDYWNLQLVSSSSLKQAGEALLYKPQTDILITGTIQSPNARPLAYWTTSILIKDQSDPLVHASAQVTGPRHWHHRTIQGWTLTDPLPTTGVPIRYELAYGGANSPENPSGTGAFGKSPMATEQIYPAPQWQFAHDPVTTPNRHVALAGFGPIARFWASRYQYAGTYDDLWKQQIQSAAEQGVPLDYPADFNLRFFQCAHPGLITRTLLQGNEQICLRNMLAHDPSFFTRLPGLAVHASLYRGWGPWTQQRMRLDTIHIDLDAQLVDLCWRLTLPQSHNIRAAILTSENMS